MDLDGIIRDLIAERNRLDRLIRELQKPEKRLSPAVPAKSRRGRKFMDGPARKEVSERMKRYWAKRREEAAASDAENPCSSAASNEVSERVSPPGPGCALNETGTYLNGAYRGVDSKTMTA
jgi:hypothetical protein